jgi:hypothetical protein
VREQIRKVIENATRAEAGNGIDAAGDPALRLASETIRLARLAASTHMILSARLTDESHSDLAEPLAVREHAS